MNAMHVRSQSGRADYVQLRTSESSNGPATGIKSTSVFDPEDLESRPSSLSIVRESTDGLDPSISPRPLPRTTEFAQAHPALIITITVCLSSALTLFNKAIFSNLQYPYPLFLLTVHLSVASIGTRILYYTTTLLDSAKEQTVSFHFWSRHLLPIGLLYGGTLIFSNAAYVTLSVSFIQMLKAFTPVVLLVVLALVDHNIPPRRTVIIVTIISCGIALASYGEIEFALIGFIFQSVGILFEVGRLITTQKLLQDMHIDPVVTLHYFAPVCAVLAACLVPVFEGWEPIELLIPRLGLPILISSSLLAFSLNICVMFMLSCTSSLVLTLVGIIKDILLVLLGVFLMANRVSQLQAIGFSISVAGLIMYKVPQEELQRTFDWVKARLGR